MRETGIGYLELSYTFCKENGGRSKTSLTAVFERDVAFQKKSRSTLKMNLCFSILEKGIGYLGLPYICFGNRMTDAQSYIFEW